MRTILDTRHELRLEGLQYDGESLAADVSGLIVGERRHVVSDGSRYLVTFSRPFVHLVMEEFPAVIAGLIQGTDTGFLRILENEQLREVLGLATEPFNGKPIFALITAHEIVVACCGEMPIVTALA